MQLTAIDPSLDLQEISTTEQSLPLQEEDIAASSSTSDVLLSPMQLVATLRKKSCQEKEPLDVPFAPPISPVLCYHVSTAPMPIPSAPPACLHLIGTLCSQMHYMHKNDVSTTRFTLCGEHFSTSPLYGAEVIIQEFSTAPKLFNIQILAQAAALPLVQSSLPRLFGQIQTRKLPFGIHRVETGLIAQEEEFEEDR